jgi:hypothetical protein
MDTTTMIILGLVVLALIVLLIWASARNKARQAEKRDELRERFGPEYDRAVQEHGSEKEAANRLGDVAKTRDKLEIVELSPTQRDRYASDWMEVQAAFVDAPDAAVRDADRLVGSVMRDRGYPVDDFDTQSDMVAADHPTIAQNYRAAHAIRMRTDQGSNAAGTEDLRQAFVHYRLLFAELLADGGARMDQTDDGNRMDQGDRMNQSDRVDQADQMNQSDRMDRGDQVDLTGRDRTVPADHYSTQERPER